MKIVKKKSTEICHFSAVKNGCILHRRVFIMKKKVFQCTPKHYDNTTMQYTAIFHSCKNYNFQMKNCYIFLIFAQKVDYWYMVKLLQKGCSNKCQ